MRRFIQIAWLVPLVASPLAAQTGAEVSGRVLDQDLAPVTGADVQIVDLFRITRTDEEGRFTFADVPPGTYVVRVETDARGTAVERIEVTEDGVDGVVLSLNPAFHLDQIVVAASPMARTREELFQAAQALSGRSLRRRLAPTLGETVSREPGVNATYFGPAASRPVIRGLGGDRVRVLEGGVGTGDASSTSPDHAVSVEPHHAERIEIVRGPATLLYGSSAIGGVVNVIDRRIPREVPLESLQGELLALGSTVADERTISGELETGTGSWAFHGSGLLRRTGNYEIPGFADVHAAEEGAAGDPPGFLPNSEMETERLALGGSWIGSRSYLGLAVSGYDSRYGVPGHGHAEEDGHAHEEPGVEEAAIDLEQRRLDVEGRWRFGGFVRALQARLGLSDYEHVELEGSTVGTRFLNDASEARLEIQHGFLGFDGALGAQFQRRDFAALGDEAFIPPSDTELRGLFLFEEGEVGPLRFQLGGRLESQRSRTDGPAPERAFTAVSGSAGVSWTASDAMSLALSASRSVKLPNAEELYSDGPHLATRAYELGDPGLGEEVGRSLDLTLHLHGDRLEGQVGAFVTDFDGFVYQRFTGDSLEALPVLRYDQADARFLGLEGQADIELFHRGIRHLILELSSDWVRATRTAAEEPLPRIPPVRAGAGLRYDGQPWSAGLRVGRTFDQDRVAPLEEPTDGHSLVDAEVGYRFVLESSVHELVLSGRNLTDQEARNHVSLLKEAAPLPGRDLRLTYRVMF